MSKLDVQEPLATPEGVDARQIFATSIALGTVLSFLGVAAGLLAMGEGWGAAVGLGAFVGFWGGLGFGAMVGGVIWATRSEHT